MVLAMAFDDFSCMTLAMLLVVGLFDMSLLGFVDIFCTSKAHRFDVPLLSSLFGVDVTMSGFFSRSPTLVLELFAASHLYVECLNLLAPLLDV